MDIVIITLWPIVNSAANDWHVNIPKDPDFSSLDMHPEVELLDHMTDLFLIFFWKF